MLNTKYKKKFDNKYLCEAAKLDLVRGQQSHQERRVSPTPQRPCRARQTHSRNSYTVTYKNDHNFHK